MIRKTIILVVALSALLGRAQQWVLTDSLNSGQAGHVAVKLADGRVLIMGGGDWTSQYNTCQIYDPTTEIWNYTDSLNVARCEHAAVLLHDGNVLVIGGMTSGTGSLGICELYDPNTGTWSLTDTLRKRRDLPRAVVLNDDRVLVVGGMSSSFQGVPECEIYDPSTGQWSLTDSLMPRRIANELCLLTDGKVLSAAGFVMLSNPESPTVDRIDTYLRQKVLSGKGKLTTDCQIYDPSTEQWTPTGGMIYDRCFHALILLDNGDVLAVGDLSCVPECELYNYTSETWSVTGSISPGRYSHSCAKLQDGNVLLVAGYASSFLSDCELYDPSTGQWTDTCDILPAREYHSATLLDNGGVLVPGGWAPGELLDCQIYIDQSSIAEQTSNAMSEFKVMPNPFTTYAMIPGYKEKHFTLYDISGQQVGIYQGNRIGEGLSAGVYFVKSETKNTKPVLIVKVR